jgi:ADP-ribosylglycohydrolase
MNEFWKGSEQMTPERLKKEFPELVWEIMNQPKQQAISDETDQIIALASALLEPKYGQAALQSFKRIVASGMTAAKYEKACKAIGVNPRARPGSVSGNKELISVLSAAEELKLSMSLQEEKHEN